MSKIAYDPVKDKLSGIIKGSRSLRRLFYFLLDLFFLRSWHIRRLIKQEGAPLDKSGGWTLLDAGSGFGQYDRFILKHFENVKVHSIDVKKDYLEENKQYFKDDIEKGRIKFYEADLLSFSSPVRFDIIICIDVLEHIEEDVKVMKNLAKSLKNGGTLLIHSPSHFSEEDAGEDDSFVGEHARAGYSKRQIFKKLEAVGLSPVEVHYTYGFWGQKAWVLSVKWPMIWINKMGFVSLLLLLIYYPVVLPFCLVMNAADLFTKNEKGNGVYALGKRLKNSNTH